MSTESRSRLLELFKTRAVSFGKFVLASGKESTYYINSSQHTWIDNAFYTTNAVGQISSRIAWNHGPMLNVVHRQMNPFDETGLIGGLSVSTGAAGLAVRVALGDSWTPPAAIRPSDEQIV